LVAALLAPLPVSTQQPGRSAPAQKPVEAGPQPAVRVTTRLVQLHVVVHTYREEPVRGLKKEDFTLYDQGEPQDIAMFSEESSEARPASTIAAAPAESNVFSNRVEQRTGAPPTVTVILIDELNTQFNDKVYAKDQVVKFLQQVRPNDRIALYVLRNDIRVLHEFTGDATRLLRALERHRSGYSSKLEASEPEPPDTGDAQLDDWLTTANERMSDFFTRNRVNITVGAMKGIARHLARIPGRKNLVWVSSSFPISIGLERERSASNMSPHTESFQNEIREAARALNEANVSIYPVDARGLVGWRGPLMTMNAGGRPLPGPGVIAANNLFYTQGTMIQLAESTGGLSFRNTNDIQGSIRKAVDDSRVTYVLGFYPTHEQWDGKYRTLKVKVSRKGETRVRHRRGYYATTEAPFGPEQRRAALAEAAVSPLEAGQIGLVARVEPLYAAGVQTAKVELRLESKDVSLTNTDGRWRGSVDLYILQRIADGRVAGFWHHTLNIAVDDAARARAAREGIQAHKHLPIAPEATELRIVVRDNSTGLLGSVIVPLSKVLRPSSTGGP
jgi:VWFA-related protein